jgi:DNA-binding NarL/FixJ family response regulator
VQARVVHADPHPLCRIGLERLLEGATDPSARVVGAADARREAEDLITRHSPDLVVTALELPGDDGLELVGWLRHHRPDTRVLVLSARDPVTFGERALRAGALGFVSKESEPQVVLFALREVLAGRIYAPAALTERVMSAMTGRRVVSADDPLEVLSDRELQVFEQLGSGRSSREVAEILGLSVKTIASHRANIQTKLGGLSLAELLRRAVMWAAKKDGGNHQSGESMRG